MAVIGGGDAVGAVSRRVTRPQPPARDAWPFGWKRGAGVLIEPWRSSVQLEWRVACVRIPRFPIGAVWRAARRGDLGATDVQLLLPFREASSLTSPPSAFSPANVAAPSPNSPPASSMLRPSSGPWHIAPSAPGHWDDSAIVLTESAGPKTTVGRRRLRAVSAEAGRAGIRAGMTIAEARAMCADIQEYPWDDVAVAGATTEMTAQLLESSPQVTPVAGAPGM